ncbi:TLD domain-containing protein [Aspergillus clavatus NRRL 1]|uniref:Restriction of telomere capping protein 5 n=1 Tax=Aspergillus clavatus (strain ATCC 1007 / CBS 513.65 / DSM 816 / NCTC 3887 / NRRL 1 / QM 1276 / 107) TaxID=344612 RepID=RTC5_ASPCL|nr:uncharacterized protein ACLA_047440 [Aspergillus clavatus NRRL 1]A1CHC0.1 RecName: Full=Restriction of telomere capping protein 5 [Aspergillus clavatus NRRL 1]EAW10275.1 conserved hypothetical protein [Aspergillus clavatus NRRL 1]
MGLGQSTEQAGHSPEQLSHVLAERFATKCFTPLELTHFKDNFFSRAIDQEGIKYWSEKILSDFLGIPDSSDSHCPLDAGPVLFRMVSYLGAFPFQNTMAPSVLTFEAMVKVVVLLTERYGKVLRRARRDRVKLLFGSLADVGRRGAGQPPDENADNKEEDKSSTAKSHATGFAVDDPANDNYEDDEDDDDLVLAALESLDAIDVFKHDSRVDKTVYEARISVATFRRLLMLLIVIAPLSSLEPVKKYTSDLNEERMDNVRQEADSILAAFDLNKSADGISFQSFSEIVSGSLPYLFDPLTTLFEHLLFSKNLDLSQKRGGTETTIVADTAEEVSESPLSSPSSIMLPGSFESTILKPSAISHLSFFLSSPATDVNLLRGNMRLHPVFSTVAHGSSLTSFSHNVLTWNSGTLLLLEGAVTESSDRGVGTITLGAYLPQHWKSGPLAHSPSRPFDSLSLPCLFELSPKHLLMQGNTSPSVHKPNAPSAYFSTNTGIAIGCQIPPPSRSQQFEPTPLGAGSLIIDASLESATFYASPIGHNGVFLPSPSVSKNGSETTSKMQIDIYTLEVWGLVPDPSDETLTEPGHNAIERQRARWDFEAREAERRRSLNLKAGAGDSAMEGARWLLETAGLIGDRPGRSGGSM